MIGLQRHQLTSPMSQVPPFRFGTIWNTNVESTMSKHYKEMFQYMKKYNLNEIKFGIDAVKRGYANGQSITDR